MPPGSVPTVAGVGIIAGASMWLDGETLTRSGRSMSSSSRVWQKEASSTSRIALRRPLMFDFGITDLMRLGPADQEVYLVEFHCRCAVIVG